MTKMKTKTILIPLIIIFVSLNICSKSDESGNQNMADKDLNPKHAFKGEIIFQSNFDGDNEIYSLTKQKLTKLTDNTWDDEYPAWSPEGDKIAFMANPRGNFDIFIMNPDGTDITPVTTSSANEAEPSWFPDGKSIAYTKEIKKLMRIEGILCRVNIDSKKNKKNHPSIL